MMNKITELVDETYYFQKYPKVKNLGLSSSKHYHTIGHLKAYSPNNYFDFDFYKKQLASKNIEVKSDENLVAHYEKIGWKKDLSPSVYFDPQYYKNKIKGISGNPFLHYLNSNDQTSPHPLIDFYESQKNNRLLEADGNNIIEKINSLNDFQIKEEHPLRIFTSPFFDEEWYSHEYNINIDISPIYHYLTTGITNKLKPHKNFLKNLYIKLNGFVDDPFSHFISTAVNTKYIPKKKPQLSVIILNWNRAITTIQCVDHLIKKTGKINEIEIIIVENGSEPKDYELLQRYCGQTCKIIQLDTNRFFGEANNIAVEACNSETLLFLNNDAFPQRSWYDNLYKILESDEDVGCVGPMYYFPDDRIQEMGGMVSSGGQVIQMGKGLFERDVCIPKLKEVDYTSAACMMMRKSLFIEIGGFDFTFEPAYFEDTDLCTKIKAAGKKVMFTSSVKVIHVENFTSKDPNIGFDFMPNVYKNRKKFVARWSTIIEEDNILGSLPRACDLNKRDIPSNGKTAVVYSPYQLVPGGGERYILSIAISLVEQGFSVSFATPERYSSIRLRNIAFDLRLEQDLINHVKPIKYDDIYDMDKPDIFICMGNEILPNSPGLGKKNIFHCQFPFPLYDRAYLQRNNGYLNSFTSIIVNSEFTKEKLEQSFKTVSIKHPEIYVVYPPVAEQNINIDYELKKNNIINVGRFISDGHNKRQDILIEAFKMLYSEAKGSLENLELHLIGASYGESRHQKYLTSLIKMAEGFPIYFHIDASPELLVEKYKEAKVYWHATGFEKNIHLEPHKMEHFGITVVEGIGFGCVPFVYEQGGPAEIISHNKQHLYSNTLELVEKTRSYLGGEGNFTSFSHISDLYNDKNFRSSVISVIDQV